MNYLLLQEELELIPESFKVKVNDEFLNPEEKEFYNNTLGLPEFTALFIRKNLDNIIEDELFTNEGVFCLRTDYENHSEFDIAFDNQPRKSFTVYYASKLPNHLRSEGFLYETTAYNILDFDDIEEFEIIIKPEQHWKPDFVNQILHLKSNFREVLENEGSLKFMDDLIIKQGLTLKQGYSMIRQAQEHYTNNNN